ncbi:MAG: DUF5103 domain-containing protein [Bacteroidetes bacterium]|uniref:DUF5103 domain-containing protein n=1 Tax=Phaeocystidibacter marisrubri TaxID=1577780 RepID=A0A6L3ZI22_9FLAO|nr:DUF5103 domain-containing protein [Phaeocystidibacter marisrubri]KAB2817238.1 DUF5103 domain-containing protein [Phaeocystidibacter marisrubri]TNE28339.1 MAG: DUF5103 domain-containing protein [Bacteroidota bacterium]GGH76298.1 DUF5103 domain-containing protein [Phaeocystidibacter marisrubri]
MTRKHLFSILLFAASFSITGQDIPAVNNVYDDNIRTVRLLRVGETESMPFVRLGANGAIKLMFDDLAADFKNYQYTFLHCNADWTPSDLIRAEYMETYQQEIIRDYNFSFNTYVPYTHYELSFPNQYIKFTKSGNYLLIVYLDTPDEPAFTLRFVIYEDVVNISSDTHRATTADQMADHQQVDFSIYHGEYPIPDAFRDLKVTVMQNHRWDNAITNLKPRFMSNNTLNYDYDLENNFLGGNEFREFNTKNMRSLSLRVRKIEIDTAFVAYVMDEESRRFKQFITWEDLNGGYRIIKQDGEDEHTEADYIRMDFKLKYDYPLPGGCYLFGELTNWRVDPKYALTYNHDEGTYTGQFYFKQGFYNYQYATMTAAGGADTTPFEGDHWQTENEYTIIVYHREIGIRYDRVIGITTSNYIGD